MANSLPNGTTWTGKRDGASWESHGAAMEYFDGPEWLLETAPLWAAPSWTDRTDQMQSLSTMRQIRSWWGGTKPGGASFVLEQHDAEMDLTISSAIKLSVIVPSGTVLLFTGFVQRITENLRADTYATYTITCTDSFGWSAQTDVPLITGAPSAKTSDAIRALFLTYAQAVNVASVPTLTGVSQDVNYAAGNMMDYVNQLVRGNCSVLWVDGAGAVQFKDLNWWWTIPTTTVAAIGPTDGTPGKTATYRVGASKSQPMANLLDVKNDITWTGPFPAGTYTQATGALPSSLNGIRKYSDTVRVLSNASVTTIVDGLQSALGFTGSNIPIDTASVRFPANITEDAMEYAAASEITDYVEVAKASLVQSWDSWEHYHWVKSVKHEWDPVRGWYCTLGLMRNVPDFNFEA